MKDIIVKMLDRSYHWILIIVILLGLLITAEIRSSSYERLAGQWREVALKQAEIAKNFQKLANECVEKSSK